VGDAFTLMIAEDANHVFAIERFMNQKIARVKLENFDCRYTAAPATCGCVAAITLPPATAGSEILRWTNPVELGK
jgi:hypothetical protein